MKSQIVLTVIYIIMCLIEIIVFSKSREKLSGLQEIQSLFKITPIMIPILYTIGCTVEGIVFERLPHILLILALGLIAYLIMNCIEQSKHDTK